jgi:S1-C subfamily serine protease
MSYPTSPSPRRRNRIRLAPSEHTGANRLTAGCSNAGRLGGPACKHLDLIAEVQRVIPDLDILEEKLQEEPNTAMGQMVAAQEVRANVNVRGPRDEVWTSKAVVGPPVDEIISRELDPGKQRILIRSLEGARRALRKIRKEGRESDLDAEELLGAEAIVVVFGRPAILIQDGHFLDPPHPWEGLAERRDSIEQTFRSVGRIEVANHPTLDWVGTGFLLADEVVVTNRHVAKEFCRPVSSKTWDFEPAMEPRIDFAEEFGGTAQREFPLTEVIGVHDHLDVALFRVGRRSKELGKLPDPLALAPESFRLKRGGLVFLVGYPAPDSRRLNDPGLVQRIFSGIFGVKRLQPGEIRGRQPSRSTFTHDCSTLNGNSGSAVFDLETGQLVGLHFQGLFLEANWALALLSLRGDWLLKKAKIERTTGRD